jgi:DNA-directed RNA polymerase subunit A"
MDTNPPTNSLAQIEEFLNFIVPRPGFAALKSEQVIVSNQKKALIKDLWHVELTDELRDYIKHAHYNGLASPGECAGIAGAQAMGEFSTQATLNTFHITGFDTGVNSGVDRFQEIINASKNPKNVECVIFFKTEMQNIEQIKKEIQHDIVSLNLNKLIYNMYILRGESVWHQHCHLIFSSRVTAPLVFDDYHVFRYVLRKKILYTYFLHPVTIKTILEQLFPNVNIIVLFSPLSKRGRFYLDIFFAKTESLTVIRDVYINKIENAIICGLPSITDIMFHMRDKEWIVETRGGTLCDIAHVKNVDMTRVYTNNIWDIYHTLGIEATYEFLLNELCKIISGVEVHNISLLVSRMTFNGSIASITRYTMRNEAGTISKASFEESMETFIKASKFGESDNFKGISAEIIAGRQPSVGTNSFEVRIDLDKIQHHGI